MISTKGCTDNCINETTITHFEIELKINPTESDQDLYKLKVDSSSIFTISDELGSVHR